MIRIAILIDGAFYKKMVACFQGNQSPKESANNLYKYCQRHVYSGSKEICFLYRVFYYDCPPSSKNIYHPLLQKSVNLSKSSLHKWNMDFLNELKSKRKFALRLGSLSDEHATYNLNPEVTKKLLNNSLSLSDITEKDFHLSMKQKGVDMRIGIDIVSMAIKKQVDRIVLISGDSDFVPAAKMARREGIDFILDPLRAPIKPELYEHIDGLKSFNFSSNSNQSPQE